MRTLLPAALCALLALPARAQGFVPHPALRFEASAEEIRESCRKAKSRSESALAGIASLGEAARTFDNTPAALDRALAGLSDDTASDQFLKYVSVSSSARDAANDCETWVGQFSVETYAREDLHEALRAYAAKGEALGAEDRRLLDKQLLDFKRSGLALPKARREELLSLRRRLVELEALFGKNLNEEKGYGLFTRAELSGAGEEFLAARPLEDGKLKVTLDYPDYFGVMDHVAVPATRRALESKFNNRAERTNLPLLREVLDLRLRAARLLGYPTHAHFILEDRMAKSPEEAGRFLSRMSRRLEPLARRELETLRALKFVFEGDRGELKAWDWRFYDNQLKKAKHSLDQEKIKEYFPAERVTERMLALYQELLGVKFRRVEGARLWHPDARLYAVADAAGGAPLAHFYLDLFPREGKYKHAAAFTLASGRLLEDGRYQAPVSAMVANFEKPGAERPALLTHREVETLFHEFGHIMHQCLTRARHARFSGSSTARDFVEAPSQMLENWVWSPEVLRGLSGHYKTGAPLPEDLLARMVAAKNVNAGLSYRRQLLFGLVDQAYHAKPPADTTRTYAKLMKEVSLFPMSEGTHPEASFGHLMGYDAGYYGYLWSEVYAQDMFSRFEEGGLLNPALGRLYRKEILEPGSSREESESLRAFLGREPDEAAFLRSLGLK